MILDMISNLTILVLVFFALYAVKELLINYFDR